MNLKLSDDNVLWFKEERFIYNTRIIHILYFSSSDIIYL